MTRRAIGETRHIWNNVPKTRSVGGSGLVEIKVMDARWHPLFLGCRIRTGFAIYREGLIVVRLGEWQVLDS